MADDIQIDSMVTISGAEYVRLMAENARLRAALRLIAEHPVEQSKKWEVGAREMLKLARATLGGKNEP